jgi:CRISPR/Cas system-associated exonuclease Cas4 (RecB family)
MGFSFKGLFCGSEPNKTKLTNEINQRFSNEIESNISSVTKQINDIINASVKKVINNTKISGSANSNVSQAFVLEDTLVDGSTLNFNFNSEAKSKQEQYAEVMKNNTSIDEIRTNIVNEIKSKAQASTDFQALLSSMNSANNDQSKLTQGEMNNMVNKLTGLFDYSSTNTDIKNKVNTELKIVITNRI